MIKKIKRTKKLKVFLCYEEKSSELIQIAVVLVIEIVWWELCGTNCGDVSPCKLCFYRVIKTLWRHNKNMFFK